MALPLRARPLIEGASLPLLVEPERAAGTAALADWAAADPARLQAWLHEAGGLLLRGFGLETAEDFRRVAEAILSALQAPGLGAPGLKPYVGGDSPRSQVAEGVYTSTEFPPHLEIGLHNELSYATWWPERLMFFCRVPAAAGGATHIADGRRVLAALDADVRQRFAERGVLYLQHLRDAAGPPGPGKSWQETFETEDRGTVEAHADGGGMALEWTARGLSTALRRPAVVRHPETGAAAWFNQADLWHAALGGAEIWDAPAGDPHPHHHARYGDGSDIPLADLAAVRAAYRACEVVFPWQAGDLLLLDNRLALHGRKPYEGAREVLVAMG